MTAVTLRSDPAKISSTLKEAVVDAIVNMTFSQISGQGQAGLNIYGARPRMLLNSGFLLPQRAPTGDDEVTSPIWISSHGLQAQLTQAPGALTVKPKLSVYVRVLPNVDDLRRPNCQPSFLLRKEVFEELRAERNAKLDAEWEKVKGARTSKFKHPEWAAIRARIVDEVYVAKGVPRHILTASVPSEEPGENDDGEGTKEVAETGAAGTFPIRDAHFEPLTVPHKWLRLDIDLPPLQLDLAKSSAELQCDIDDHSARMNATIAERLRTWADSDDPNIGGKAWGYRRLLTIPASQYHDWPTFLENVRKSSLPVALPTVEVSWGIELSQDWLESSKRNLYLTLENTSKPPTKYLDETDEAVFLVSLVAELPKPLHHPLKLERIEPSYRLNRYLSYPALGHNGGVQSSSSDDVITLETTWCPRFVQPRIVPTTVRGVTRHVRTLSQDNSLDGLRPLVPAMQAWLDGLPLAVDLAAGLATADIEGIDRERLAFSKDLLKWAGELKAVAAGLAILEESRGAWTARGAQTSNPKAVVYEAWLAMNEAMADFMKARFRNDDSEWRLFQLAFILANLSSLASRVPEFRHHYDCKRDDAVTLLYFATGGGKSEAFFGLLVFNLLLDRLRGKHTGITALIRYPLRLLTIQQAQRCAKVLANAELVRRQRGYPGSPLSIGFWVGSGGSPNKHSARGVDHVPTVDDSPPTPTVEAKLIDEDSHYGAALRAWRKLPRCPFCNSNVALRRLDEGGDHVLGHVCTDLACPSNGGRWMPLPFYIVDEDIYDLAPSVLLGTVDKLALIGHSERTIRRIYGMFGAAPWFKPASHRLYVPTAKELAESPKAKGMVGLYPAYADGQKLFFDPFPSLIIQDEAHLLDESLGTFAGLFESTLDAVFSQLGRSLSEVVAQDADGNRRRPKVIAASATVSEPQRQLEHLYQRSIPATQFPEPGPSLYESFYAEPQRARAEEVDRLALPDVEVASRQARVYTAFMTNGKPHTATSVAVLSGFHLVITQLFDALTMSNGSELQATKTLLQDHIRPGPLRELHTSAIANASSSDLATTVDLHRIALTYVTNKKGGDQLMAAEAEETRKRHQNIGIPLDAIDTRLITGSVEQGEIQGVVDTAQYRVKEGEPFPPLRDQLRSVIATSAISHGVDVDEFNSMFFAGMPSDIAEYIQASSRVGRTHIGFVVLIPTPQRRRDRHIVHIFDVFHRFLERMVQPAAIDRWAERAIERVFPSLFQAYLLGVVPSRELISLPPDKKAETPDFSYIPNVRRELNKRGDAFIHEINKFIELAVGLQGGFAPEGEDHYKRKIDERTRTLIVNAWGTPLWGSGQMGNYFQAQTDPMLKPMNSLRDVDQGGRIQMSPKDSNGDMQRPDDVHRVMDLIRNGVADNDGSGA